MELMVNFEQAQRLYKAGIITTMPYRDGIVKTTTGELEEWIMQHTGLKWQELIWITLADGYGLNIDSYENKIDFLVDLCIKMKNNQNKEN